eukprot:11210772-Lingulodinium_polyedra.AAC.1
MITRRYHFNRTAVFAIHRCSSNVMAPRAFGIPVSRIVLQLSGRRQAPLRRWQAMWCLSRSLSTIGRSLKTSATFSSDPPAFPGLALAMPPRKGSMLRAGGLATPSKRSAARTESRVARAWS